MANVFCGPKTILFWGRGHDFDLDFQKFSDFSSRFNHSMNMQSIVFVLIFNKLWFYDWYLSDICPNYNRVTNFCQFIDSCLKSLSPPCVQS